MLVKTFVYVLACFLNYIQLPSGSIYCRAPRSVQKNFDDAQSYCKSIGFTGLAELRNSNDSTMIAGVNQCESFRFGPNFQCFPKSDTSFKGSIVMDM